MKILDLASDMSWTITCIADVEQFASTTQLKRAFDELKILIKDVSDFIVKFSTRGKGLGTGMGGIKAWISNLIKWILGLLINDEETIRTLFSRFVLFKERFDRGIAVQSNQVLRSLVMALSESWYALVSIPDIDNTI